MITASSPPLHSIAGKVPRLLRMISSIGIIIENLVQTSFIIRILYKDI